MAGIVLIVAGLVLIFFISIFNKLIRLKNQVKNAFTQIDVQLKRRYDLIPNLVETAKGYLRHERGTLEAVITARNSAQHAREEMKGDPTNSGAMLELQAAEATLTGSLGKLFALSENYPDLKGNTTMQQLMEELSSTENRISFARQHFNDTCMEYNTAQEVFPNSLVVGFGSFSPAELWQLEGAEAKAAAQPVKVSFD